MHLCLFFKPFSKASWHWGGVNQHSAYQCRSIAGPETNKSCFARCLSNIKYVEMRGASSSLPATYAQCDWFFKHCTFYPNPMAHTEGKVAIFRHLPPPGSPSVTILSASSVWMLVHCVVKYSRLPDLKSSSNVSLPFVWITGPTTDPSSLHSEPASALGSPTV